MKKKLLLHICCAPDATVGIERLSSDWEMEGLFLNSNIHPAEEYTKRLKALETLSLEVGLSFTEGPYEPRRGFRASGAWKGSRKKGYAARYAFGSGSEPRHVRPGKKASMPSLLF